MQSYKVISASCSTRKSREESTGVLDKSQGKLVLFNQ